MTNKMPLVNKNIKAETVSPYITSKILPSPKLKQSKTPNNKSNLNHLNYRHINSNHNNTVKKTKKTKKPINNDIKLILIIMSIAIINKIK